jgi:hypothetical protein
VNATCFYCGRTFSTERTDAMFCSDVCRAASYRDQGATRTHRSLHSYKSKMCGHCGNLFWFNDYADRKGSREPQYCGAKCRKTAWTQRAKAKAGREQDMNGAYKKAYQKSQEEEAAKKFSEAFEKAHEQQKQKQTNTSDDFRDKLITPRRWSSFECYQWIFGDRIEHTQAECNTAMRALNKKYHPDANEGKVYDHLSTLNAAWDYLKRNVWKK